MKGLSNKIWKISIIAILSVALILGMCFGIGTIGQKGNTKDTLSVQTTPQSSETDTTSASVSGLSETSFQQLEATINETVGANYDSTNDINGFYTNGLEFVVLDTNEFNSNKVIDFTIVIAFINFSGGPSTWKQSDITTIMNGFNDDDSSNDIYSVHEYFKEQTYGKLNVHAVYVERDSKVKYSNALQGDLTDKFGFEEAVYTDALNHSDSVKNEKGEVISVTEIGSFNCRFSYYPYDSTGWNTFFWPHAWKGQAFISSPLTLIVNDAAYKSPQIATIDHELIHVLGFPDLYVYESTDVNPIGYWDIMGHHDKYNPHTMNAYFKSKLNLVSTSDYGYNDSSRIREITSSGEYTLAPTNAKSGTIAYKFAERSFKFSGKTRLGRSFTDNAKEMFFVEYKKKSTSTNQPDYYLPDSGLIIYRIIESEGMLEDGNSYPSLKGSVKYFMYVLRPEGETYPKTAIKPGNSFGSVTNKSSNNTFISRYDGTNTGIMITHNGYDKLGNAKIQFTFAEDVESYSLSGYFSINGVPSANATITAYVPAGDGSYTLFTPNNNKTNSNGYFYIKGLKKGSIINFAKDGQNYSNLYTVTQSAFDQFINYGEELYTLSGTLKVDYKIVAGAKVMLSIPTGNGTYTEPIFTGVVTDSNGKFYVTGLANGSQITFEGKGAGGLFAVPIKIEGKSLINITVNELTPQRNLPQIDIRIPSQLERDLINIVRNNKR